MSSQQQYIVESKVQFHEKPINRDWIEGSECTAQFGILQFNAATCEISQSNHDIILTIDCSGSMCDLCSDYKSKMDHIIHVAINIVTFIKDKFSEKPGQVRLSIYAFDDTFDCILEREYVTDETYDGILRKLRGIVPRNGTNIELALTNIQQKVCEILQADTTTLISHMFMTDGITNMGNEEPEFLTSLVNNNIKNAFIGVGLDHDGSLLTSLGSCKNACYYFIDKLEKAGLAYGEIIHTIFYTLLKNVHFKVINGTVYDYKSNTWVDSLAVGDIVSGAEKTYHLMKYNEGGEFIVKLTAIIPGPEEEEEFDYSFGVGDGTGFDFDTRLHTNSGTCDLTKYIYRQRTMQYLYQARVTHTDDIRALKTVLSAFKKEMKQYMDENGLSDDPFMKNLYDDIYICRKSVGRPYSLMYVMGRQTSQGTQQGYTVSHVPKNRGSLTLPPPPPRRQPCMIARQMSIVPRFTPTQVCDDILDFDEDDGGEDSDSSDSDQEYEVSQTTNYLSPQATQVMREISS
jgi:hypothetical protein